MTLRCICKLVNGGLPSPQKNLSAASFWREEINRLTILLFQLFENLADEASSQRSSLTLGRIGLFAFCALQLRPNPNIDQHSSRSLFSEL